ncbi:MAG: ankyrin repeat domain-containing protein [Actinomycetota bacterium]|nr:ankyrin repeat domain-containing protein [Actinomycetota bacterium]
MASHSATNETSRTAGGTTQETPSDVTPENATADRQTDLALVSAASRGDLRAVERLLEQGANVNARDESGGTTPVIAAAYGDHAEVAGTVIEAGADVNLTDSGGVTPFNTPASGAVPR